MHVILRVHLQLAPESTLSIHLPNLSGEHLTAMRKSFGLSQSDLGRDTGCSVSAIQKAEAARALPIGPTLARAIAPHLLGSQDVMLELSLTLPAIQLASRVGVRPWTTEVGVAWWLPQVKSWRQTLALQTHRTFGSIDSMARFICAHLGIDEEDGVLRCNACEEAGVDDPAAAWRACTKCGKFLCGSEECGRYVIVGGEDLRESPPVLCRPCARHLSARLVRRPEVLPGTDRVGQLASMWADLRTKCKPNDAYHNGFLLIVEDELEEAAAKTAAVKRALRTWSPGRHHALEAALEEVDTERAALNALRQRVSDFLPPT